MDSQAEEQGKECPPLPYSIFLLLLLFFFLVPHPRLLSTIPFWASTARPLSTCRRSRPLSSLMPSRRPWRRWQPPLSSVSPLPPPSPYSSLLPPPPPPPQYCSNPRDRNYSLPILPAAAEALLFIIDLLLLLLFPPLGEEDEDANARSPPPHPSPPPYAGSWDCICIRRRLTVVGYVS